MLLLYMIAGLVDIPPGVAEVVALVDSVRTLVSMDITLLVVVLVVVAPAAHLHGELDNLLLLVTVVAVVEDPLVVVREVWVVLKLAMDMVVLVVTLVGIIMEILVGLLTVVMETLVMDMQFFLMTNHHHRLIRLRLTPLH